MTAALPTYIHTLTYTHTHTHTHAHTDTDKHTNTHTQTHPHTKFLMMCSTPNDVPLIALIGSVQKKSPCVKKKKL